MKRGRSKAKGSSFERLIAGQLSLWLTGGKDDKQLIRTVLSGGWQTRQEVSGPEGWRQVGDLAPNGPAGEFFRRKFSVECKHQRGIDILALWTRTVDKQSIFSWWKKLVAESDRAGVEPMLIFRSNGRPIMVGVRSPGRIAVGLALGKKAIAVFPWLDLAVFQFTDLLTLSVEYALDGKPPKTQPKR